mgnify:CR=1 FL=1
MEDMASALGSILNNPQAMQQIMGLASQLGLGSPAPAEAPPPPPPAPDLPGGLDLGALAKIAGILGSMKAHDQNVDLLLALKPHFGEKRRKKVDDAIRVMQLVRLLPQLREAGLFNLFGSEEDSSDG